MPFISSYKEANKILTEIGNGTCNKGCKKVWIRNLKYALKTECIEREWMEELCVDITCHI
jgi:hypothetical protein